MKARRENKSVRGSQLFSLIELLVVIAIISMLLTLLMPALREARMTAVRIECAGKLKQLTAAAHMYVTDYNGWFPQEPTDNSKNCWDAQIADYLRYRHNDDFATYKDWGPPLYHCPAGFVRTGRNVGAARGYFANNSVVANAYGDGRIGGSRTRNAELLLFGEYWINAADHAETYAFGTPSNQESRTQSNVDMMAWRHRGGMNYSRCDGSVQWNRPGNCRAGAEAIWTFYYGAGAYDRWQDGLR